MIGMKESEWIEIFLPTHDILNLEPCVWRPVWDKWRLVVPSCGAPSQNSGYLEWKVNDCQEAICRENWSNTWAIWKNKAHPWPKKKQSKLQSMSIRCNLWSSGASCCCKAWLSKSLCFVSTKYLTQASVVRNWRIEFKDYGARSFSYLHHQKRGNESGKVDGENDKLSN